MGRKKKLGSSQEDGRDVLLSLNGDAGKVGKSDAAKRSSRVDGRNGRSGSGNATKGRGRSNSNKRSAGEQTSKLAKGAAVVFAKPASAAVGLLVRALTCLCLAFSLFGAGLLACSSKEATQAIGQTFSGWSDSTLPADDMAAIAEEVRLFSMGQASNEELTSTIIDHVKGSYPEVAKVLETGSLVADTADQAQGLGQAADASGANQTAEDGSAQESASSGGATLTQGPTSATTGTTTGSASSAEQASRLADQLGLPASLTTGTGISTAKIDSWFSLPDDAVSHLADCIPVFVTAQGATVFAAIVALAGLIWLGVFRGRKAVGQTLVLGACIPLTALLVIAIWALADFDGLFAAMHSLFFAAGTWTFPSDSLLIRLFPEAFWAAMAGLWAAVSIGLSLACLVIGRLIRKGAK